MHTSVLRQEVLEALAPQPNQNFIDGTGGAAGHTLAILEKTAPRGKVLFIDKDGEAIAQAKEIIAVQDAKLLERVILVKDSYAKISEIVAREKFTSPDGILLDLGLSSDQLEDSGRGFSFQRNEPLDMRFDTGQELTAREILNHWEEREIVKILKDYGEEPFARKIGEAVIKNRKIKSILGTAELVDIISQAIPLKFQHGRLHFATRTFQALRIAVNDELGNLQRFLPQALDILAVGGRLAIIAFHSLEDRLVKNYFRVLAQEKKAELLNKKPIMAGEAELIQNPRSRSAKLRAIKKL